jgi:hypothetical protein
VVCAAHESAIGPFFFDEDIIISISFLHILENYALQLNNSSPFLQLDSAHMMLLLPLLFILFLLFRSWDCTMMVTQVLTIIMMIKVKPSSFTHKLKELIGLLLLAAMMLHVQVVLSMKNMRAKEGASVKAIK